MSRKRLLKKHQKRQGTLLAQLEELYLQGAGDEFLLLAEHLEDPAASPVAAEWTEVVERAVRESLAGGDLGRLSHLVRSIRRSGRLRSLTVLVEAVLDLAAGRLLAARGRLADLAGLIGQGDAGDTGSVPRDLLSALQALAEEEPGSPPSGPGRLDEPYLQAVRELFGALQRLEAASFASTPDDRRDLARRLAALRSAAPSETPDTPEASEITGLHRLLASAGRSLSFLGDLAALEGGRQATSQEIAGWLRAAGPLFVTALGGSAPPLLAPLQHAVHLRWRAVLERVAAREGATGLAVLRTAAPELLAHDLVLPRRGSTALQEADQVRKLLAARRYDDLARLLRARSRPVSVVPDAGELAALWSLELWAIDQIPDEEPDGEWEGPPAHRTIVRLHEMAGEIGRRFPPELRAEVARVLRDRLFEACRQTFFCDHVAWVALALLEQLPDDVGLLVAGVAGAVVGEDRKSAKALEARLGRSLQMQAQVQAKDREVCRSLMVEISKEGPRNLAFILDRLRPLFGGDLWPEIAALVAGEIGRSFGRILCEVTLEGGNDIGRMRTTLDRLRPFLAGTPGFAAIEVIIDCWQQNRKGAEKRLAQFLSAFPELDAPLAAFRVLDGVLLPWSPQGGQAAMERLSRAVIDRLDERWQLWTPAVPLLAVVTEAGERRRLETKIRQLLTTGELAAEGRDALEHALKKLRELEELRKSLERPPRRGGSPDPEPREPSQPNRKPRTRRSSTPQLRLDL
jgi:hypothetical protein